MSTANQFDGIQQLLAAEKRAADKVNEARKRKIKRLKQAGEEARAEIEKFRQQCETQFRQYESKHLGSKGDVQIRMDEETRKKLETMQRSVTVNKEKVLERILSTVCDIKPEVHHNFKLKTVP